MHSACLSHRVLIAIFSLRMIESLFPQEVDMQLDPSDHSSVVVALKSLPSAGGDFETCHQDLLLIDADVCCVC